jgi:hypothetical protein
LRSQLLSWRNSSRRLWRLTIPKRKSPSFCIIL